MEDNNKKVTVEITKDSWKVFKILAIQMECTLQKVIFEVLEKYASSRNISSSAGRKGKVEITNTNEE